MSLDILPLVEFVPDSDLTDEEVQEYIKFNLAKCHPKISKVYILRNIFTRHLDQSQKGDNNSFTFEQDLFAEKLVTLDVSA